MYKRLSVYPNGQPIPESLPESYQPASYGNAPAGQSCFTCKNFNMANRYCSAWKAPVKPRWWCEGWASVKPMLYSPNPTLLKKITTSTVEEHFSEIPKATQLDYYDFGNENDYEEESDTEIEGDVIKLNVPLVIRLLEYAREDANKDVDLHLVAENLISLSQEGDVLDMDDYADIVTIESED